MGAATIASFTERTTCISCGSRKIKRLSEGRFDQGLTQKFINEDPWGEHPAPFLQGHAWSYVACVECGQAFHGKILAPDWNERRFSKWMSQAAIEAFEKPRKTPARAFQKAAEYTKHALRIEKLTRTLRGTSAPRILDFGCGYGGFLSMCAMFGFEAVGVDRSSAKRDHGSYTNVFAEIDDVEELPQFHALTLFEVIEHLDDPYRLMERLAKLLVTNGILVLEAPDCSGVLDIKTRHDYSKIHPLEHINGFTPATLRSFAERLGFVYIPRPTAWVTSDIKAVGKSVAKQLLGTLVPPTTQMYFRKR